MVLTGLKLCICALPVFVKFPGMERLDLGSRTEGDETETYVSIHHLITTFTGFVTNRRLLLSSSGPQFQS